MRRILLATAFAALASLTSCSTTRSDGDTQIQGNTTIVYLKNASSADMAATLQQFLREDGSGRPAVVVSHAESNSLLIQATGEKQRQLLAIIGRLDAPRD